MEQHPIPQQITSYEFKLVGEMTLKQFGKAAGGIIIALLINATGLVFFVKWPLMFIFAAGGLAMAFVPFQDRPLETWLLSFIRSIYMPTIYVWKKKPNPNWLDIDLSKKIDIEKDEEAIEIPVKSSEKVKEFIESLPSVKKEVANDIEKKEEYVPEIKTETTSKVDLNIQKQKLGATGSAVFGSIPMPDTPTEPNVLAGMVTDSMGKIIEGAIVEIQDSAGNPSRVLKTNALGQFKASTQLANGEYLVVPEKEGRRFDRVKVTLNGQIVQPIKIQAIG